MQINDGRVISNFIVQSLKGIPLTIYGNGEQIRSFCYVDDLIKGMIKLMDSNFSSPINIGNPKQFTILEIAKKIKKKINPDLEFIYKPLPEDDPIQRQPDIQKAIDLLDWHPETSFDEGLLFTINWFKDILKNK